MKRRKFFILMGLVGLGAVGLLISNIYRRKELRKYVKSTLHHFKPTVSLPEEGKTISLETALNSRCTSDYDGDPERFHWGMFDKSKKLSSEQIKRIIALARIPRFTNQNIEICLENNLFTFIVPWDVSGVTKDWIMVESGMQQQAVGLVCAALGVGIVFRSLGKNGMIISGKGHQTVKMKVDPMWPCYNGKFWSNATPTDSSSPWKKGNLPDPDRRGAIPLLSALQTVVIEANGFSTVTDKVIGQLLWAARGRTPHYYKSRPWGMTIPTSKGEQNNSSVLLIRGNGVFNYINWEMNRPTHAIKVFKSLSEKKVKTLRKIFSPYQIYVILKKNQDAMKAVWEIGYQLLNMSLQSKALNISYKAVLLDTKSKKILKNIGIDNAEAALLV